MTKELIQRLRDSSARHDKEADRLCKEAADVIEALQAENERLKADIQTHQRSFAALKADTDALAAKLVPLAKNGKDAYQKLQQAAAQIVSAQSEPSRWGCVGPDAQDIAWDKFNELANSVCLAMDSPPIDAAKGGQHD